MQCGRTQNRPPQGAQPAHNGGHQRLHRHARPIGNGRVNVLEHLHVKRPGRAHQRGRQRNRAQLDPKRIDAHGLRGFFVVPHCLKVSAEARALEPPGGQ